MPVNKNVSRSNQKRRKNQVGGDWEGGGQQGKEGSQNRPEDHGSDVESTPDEQYPKTNNKTFGSAYQTTVSDGSFEQQWVNSIITAVGIADNIPDLKQRVQQFHNLSQSHVLEHLDEKLGDHKSWQAQAKALSLMEGLLDDASAAPIVVEYFRASPENLQALINSKKITLKKKATTVAHKVGLETTNLEPSNAQKTTAVTHGSTSVKDDVLNLDDWLHTENTPQTRADEKQDESENMFVGLGIVNEKPKPTPSIGADEFFPGLDFGTTTTTTTTTNSTNGINNSTNGINVTSKTNTVNTINTVKPINFITTTSKTNSILTTTSNDNSSASINAFASLLSQPQNTIPPATFGRTLNITPSASRSFIDDPFANLTSQSIQPQTTKSKKPDKDPFADLALGSLKF
ncbi:hypothetical protein RFI_17025 [Reticulomyxa filosa]|uniref:Uncharacterized protein n=1 Tax=Reticulomyxa filosa TaxID=46433 RepID=X6N367_RETFI|nr:hypothetical protein RFI_17025 [Reticulomyxa filosa]|eukprot:ETO20194.1 hypothetical protein RFI_17025 [Reticulomyxa filosa]